MKVEKIYRWLRILGLWAVLGYLIVVIALWIRADFEGYMYFSAGEPISLLKYAEWLLGFIGIAAACDLLYQELWKLSEKRKIEHRTLEFI